MLQSGMRQIMVYWYECFACGFASPEAQRPEALVRLCERDGWGIDWISDCTLCPECWAKQKERGRCK